MLAEHYIALLAFHRRKRPFKVFTIESVGGRRLEIDYAKAVTTSGSLSRFIEPGGVVTWFDHEGVLRLIEEGTAQRLRELLS